jgi:hypothetical protein
LDVSTCPDVPGAAKATGDVPSPRRTACAVSVESPVPPLATGTTPEIDAALFKLAYIDILVALYSYH